MSENFTDYIQVGKTEGPRKILIYGTMKIGKTTIASAAPDTYILRSEKRHGEIECAKSPVIKDMKEANRILRFLLQEEHSFKNLVIDTIDWFEPLLHKELCEINNWKSLTDETNKETNWFKGLNVHAVAKWREFLAGLEYLSEKRGMSIILISHATAHEVDLPDNQSYQQMGISIHKSSVPIIYEWVDVIGYYTREIFVTKGDKDKTGKASGSDRRILHLGGSNPAFISENSYMFPDKVVVTLDHVSEIMSYILTGKGE